MNNTKHIVLYDGNCSFCSYWVKYILKRDKKDLFRFCSLQSDTGKDLINKHLIDSKIDSVIFIDSKSKAYVKSNAVFEILFHLGGIRKGMYVFKIFPIFIRDFVYDIVAKSRYKLFKQKTCELPLNSNYKGKFI